MMHPTALQVSFEQLSSLHSKSSAERRQFWKMSKRLARGTLVSAANVQALSTYRNTEQNRTVHIHIFLLLTLT